jgi:hypothetical protein
MKEILYKNYFLGLLSSEDAERLELQIISDNEIEPDLIKAEDDLIEIYLDGKLTITEIKAFNKNFLVTKERVERVELIRSIRNFDGKNKIKAEENPGFFENLKAYFALRPITLAVSSLVIILVVGLFWQIYRNFTVNVAETELVQLNREDLSNLNELKTLSNLSLTSTTLRSGGSVNTLQEKNLTEKTLLRLFLPNQSNDTKTYQVKIIKDGQIKYDFLQNSYPQEIRLLIPKQLLTKGNYQITIEKDGDKFNYYFAVQ